MTQELVKRAILELQQALIERGYDNVVVSIYISGGMSMSFRRGKKEFVLALDQDRDVWLNDFVYFGKYDGVSIHEALFERLDEMLSYS